MLQFRCVLFNYVGECHKNGPRISAVSSHQTVTCERNLKTFVCVFCSPNTEIIHFNLAIQKKMALFRAQNVPWTFISEITLIKNFLRFTSYWEKMVRVAVYSFFMQHRIWNILFKRVSGIQITQALFYRNSKRRLFMNLRKNVLTISFSNMLKNSTIWRFLIFLHLYRYNIHYLCSNIVSSYTCLKANGQGMSL